MLATFIIFVVQLKHNQNMATKFFISTSKNEGTAKINVRFQRRTPQINYKIATPLKVDIKVWENSLKGKTQSDNFRKDYPDLVNKMDAIKSALDATLDNETSISLDDFKKIVNSIIYKEEREAEQKRQEEEREALRKANQMTLEKYMDIFLQGIESGEIRQAKNKPYTYNSIRNIRSFCNKFKEFQTASKRKYDFADMNKDFERAFNKFLNPCKPNTLAGHYKHLKSILRKASEENFDGVSINPYFEKFDSSFGDVENIYLTIEDLQAIQCVDLSGVHSHFSIARDLFLIMVWSCQRVSDLPKICVPAHIKRSSLQLVENGAIVDKELITIVFKQQKTNRKAIIPVNSHLKALLEKYEYNIPKMAEQKINDYIKEVAKMAGLNEVVLLDGVEYQKWECVSNHTGRRTGCTLMYLSGTDPYDICKVSGHSDIKMLEKYIKASELEQSEKLAVRYREYFK